MLSILFVILLGFVPLTLAGCPFSQAFDNGQFRADIIDQSKNRLIKEQFLLTTGQPASFIWNTPVLDAKTVDLYRQSTSLLVAKQFYVQQHLVENPNANLTTIGKVDLLRSVSGCVAKNHRCTADPVCDATYKYVLTDGRCNNLQNPKWGAAHTAYSRLVDPIYDDGINTVRRSVTNAALPSGRIIGNGINKHSVYSPLPSPVLNYGSIMFGQFLAHDSGLRDVYQNNAGGPGLSCCTRDNKGKPAEQITYSGCDPIEVPRDDPFYSQFGKNCISYVRSQPILANDCSMDTTEYSNSVSQVLDLSTIYGSDEPTAKSVRAFRGGRLLIDNGVSPLRPGCTGDFCYFTGDARAMGNPTLALWHSVFIRYHNVIVSRLAAIYPRYTDEAMFQEARRIVTAVYQNVVFNEWLPRYVGAAVTERRQVSCVGGTGYCGRYDASVNPSTLNEFAVGAFRLYHVNIPMLTNLYNDRFQLISSVKLTDSIKGAGILVKNYSAMIRGLLKDPLWIGKYPDNIRNELFNNGNPDGIGIDLLAVDIARGRDHGISPYHVYLTKSTNGKLVVRTWDDVSGYFSRKSIEVLQTLYASVLDVDLLVGLLLEEKRGLYTGPVGQYIMEEQFYRYKYGDRFFYSLENNPNSFNRVQLYEINQEKIANVLCAVSDITHVFAKSFEVESPSNTRIACSSLTPINLERWRQ